MKLIVYLLGICVFQVSAQIPLPHLKIPEILADTVKKTNSWEPPGGSARYDWLQEGQDELKIALEVAKNVNKNEAKNVVLVIGDSMGPSTVTASRVYKAQTRDESGRDALLAWEKFPHVALARTHSSDRLVIDSAASGTALMCGEKTRSSLIGLQHTADKFDCPQSLTERQKCMIDWSLEAGKRVGIVTSSRLTHATPASGYAHATRFWEYWMDRAQNLNDDCKDIARQLIEDNPNINVLLGGGRAYFMPNDTADPEYPTKMGNRKDGKNLIDDWLARKQADIGDDTKYKYVYNKDQFDAIDPYKVDYVLGMFEQSHMMYDLDRNKATDPHQVDLVEKAINILKRGDKGYFLLIEAARIDHAAHNNNAKRALDDTMALSDTVQKVMELTDPKDTLVIVTGDHSFAFTINGYPSINRNILLTSDAKSSAVFEPNLNDGKPYLTLQYSNGPGFMAHRDTFDDPRPDFSTKTEAELTDKEFLQDVQAPFDDGVHGGEDLAIYASGPMSHLFHGSHEQNYVAHVMQYASCVGPNKDHCNTSNGGFGVTTNVWIMLICVLLTIFKML